MAKDKYNLVLQLLWFFIIFAPCQIIKSLLSKIIPPQEKSLKDQVVIVTGSGRGLGRALALRFAEEGAKVAVADIDRPSAMQTAQDIVDAGGNAKSYFTNVGKVDDVHELRLSVVKDFGSPDIVVNNAGLIYVQSLEDMTESEVRSVMDINLLSHFWVAQEFLPDMKKNNSGHIVAICSMSAVAGIAENGSAYTVSKYGVKGFMNCLRRELNQNPKNNIKTTTILPYFIANEKYMEQFDLSIPPLPMEDVVAATISAIKRDKVIVSVPYYMMYVSFILKLFPRILEDTFYSVLNLKVTPPTKKNKDTHPAQQIIGIEHSKKK